MVRNLHREERQRKQRQLENQVFDQSSTVDFIFFKAEQCGKSDPLGVLGELNSILEKEEERFISISAKLVDLKKTKGPKHLH